MKYTLQEFKSDYSTYRFGYTLFAELEANDNISAAFNAGFLPYSANPNDPRDLLYMARSLRIDLKTSANLFSKDRRYELRQFSKLSSLNRRVTSKEVFKNSLGPDLFTQTEKWMRQRFDQPYLNEERFQYIWNKSFFNTVLSWHSNDKILAFAFINRSENMAHYWFCFYNHEAFSMPGFGSYCMADFIEWAKSNNLEFAYLGTGYFPKSKYKIKGISSTQWWDGSSWNSDKKELLARMQNDED